MTTRTRNARKTAATAHIETCLNKGRQDLVAQRLLRINGHSVRLTVRSDAYDFQSYAVAQIWSGAELKWNEVHRIHHSQMATAHGLAYAKGVTAAAFETDLARLQEVAAQILA